MSKEYNDLNDLEKNELLFLVDRLKTDKPIKEIYKRVSRKTLNLFKDINGLQTERSLLDTLDWIIDDLEQQRKDQVEIPYEYQSTFEIYDLYEIREIISSLFQVKN